MTKMQQARTPPRQLKADLLAFEAEIQERSEALPPDGKLLAEWQGRLRGYWTEIRPLRRLARNALWSHAQRIEVFLESLRDDVDAFKLPVRRTQHFKAAGHGTRNLLAGAISGALRKRTAGDLASTAKTTQAPVDEPVALPGDAIADTLEQGAEALSQVLGESAVDGWLPTDLADPGSAQAEVAVPEKDSFGERPAILPVPEVRPSVKRAQRSDPIVAYAGRLAKGGTFAQAKVIACKWLRSRGFRLPKNIDVDFEATDGSGGKLVVVRHEAAWAFQSDTLEPRKKRRWRLEFVLVDDPASTAAVGMVLAATAPADQAPPEPSIPRLAEDLIDQIGLIDLNSGNELSITPERVTSRDQVDQLTSRLSSSERRRPIIVLSEYKKDDQLKTLLDPVVLAKELRGLAHIVVLDYAKRAAWMLTDAVSKRFAVYGPTLRLYRPGFTTEAVEFQHPAWTPAELAERGWSLSHLQRYLLKEAASSSLSLLDHEDEVPGFDAVHRWILEARIEQARRVSQLVPALQADAAELQSIGSELEQQRIYVDVLKAENAELRESMDRIREERDSLRSKNYYLEDRVNRLTEKSRDTTEFDSVVPDTWEALEDWARDYLDERVIITPKAWRAARNSKFENIGFVRDVFTFLLDTYVPDRRNQLAGGREALERAKTDLGIVVDSVGDAPKNHRYRDMYSTSYNNRTVPLDMHVTKGNQRDPRYCFRLYFHWDVANKRVVVGSFPGHLDNTLT